MKNLLKAIGCSGLSFTVLAVILGAFAATKTSPFGEFLAIIAQNEMDPSKVFSDPNYFENFRKALDFLLYFVISPIIICTGVLGAYVAKRSEYFVGMLAIFPLMLVYIIPVFSIRNILLALACTSVVICLISVMRNLRSRQSA